MTDIIICNASLEPLGFFDRLHVGTLLSVAAALSYDCREPGPADSTPKDRFEAFLKALPDVTFRVYRFNSAAKRLELAADWTATAHNVPSGDTPVANVLSWLERRGSDAKPTEYWLSPDQLPPEEFKLTDLRATQYLATSAAWPAPLPQDAGLVRVLLLTSPADVACKEDLLLVPFFAGAMEQNPIPASEKDRVVSFDYYAGIKDGEYDFTKARGEIRFPVEPKSDATSLVDESSCFLLTRADAGDIHTLIKQIEERSASLFWILPTFLSVDWPTLGDDQTRVRRLVWRAMNGLAALLDPVVMSLTMAVPGPAEGGPQGDLPGSQGPFISALAACVEDEVSTASTGGIAPFVRDELASKLRPSEGDKNSRSAVTRLLSALLGLGDPETAKFEESPLLPLLLDIYGGEYWPDRLDDSHVANVLKKATDRFTLLETTLSNELSQLAQRLQTEGGFEAVILALFEQIELIKDSSGRTAGKLETICGISKDHCTTAIADFRRRMRDVFNGLDAARHAQAQLFQQLLVATTVETSKARGRRWTAKKLAENLLEAEWFVRRLRLESAGAPKRAYDSIVQVLPVYASGALSDTDKMFLTTADPMNPAAGSLKIGFDAVCVQIVGAPTKRRFLPDHAPKPLSILLAVDTDTSDLDGFADTYNGVGVLVRREKEAWAYANLAELAQRKPLANDDKYYDYTDTTVLPLQPVAIDGQRRLFLEYDGLPFTSDAFVGTRTPSIAPEDSKAPFFKYHDPSRENLANKEPLPPLAYGRTFEVAAFVVSKGGSLPMALQADEDVPWAPIDKPANPAKKFVSKHDYWRTTAVGRMTITETPAPGSRPRIGVAIDGVQPLALDYPRVGITAEAGKSGAFDLLRNGDGTGALGLPSDKTTTRLTLSDLWWWSGKGELVVSLYCDPGAPPDVEPDVKWTFGIDSPFAGSTLTLNIAGAGSAEEPAARVLTLTCRLSSGGQPPNPAENQEIKANGGMPAILSAQSVWLRVSIKGSTEVVALSLADPLADATGDGVTTRPSSDSLVLVASPTGEWRVPYGQTVKGTITFPRVGFNDFDRWLNNPDLAAKAKNSGSGNSADDDTRFDTFRRMVMTSYVGRHIDERLASLIDYLPDLSVDRLLVELTPLNALNEAPSNAVLRKLPKISQVITLRTLGARLASLPGLDDYKKAAINLLTLGDSYMASVEISAVDEGHLSLNPAASSDREFKLEVKIPRGLSARLTVRPMVLASHLSGSHAVFDAGIATLATEIRDGYYVFDGASVKIESMLGAIASETPTRPWQAYLDTKLNRRSVEWEDLVAAATVVRPAGVHRSYDLVCRSSSVAPIADGWRWRQLASIDIQTQRWRFTGRPIYSWLDPKKRANGSGHVDAAIEQAAEDVGAFEEEIFFDRDDQDSDTQTMRLNPVPDDTVLQSFPWEQPSATYFRHRLRIRSRYEGALRGDQIATLRAWGTDYGKNGNDPESDARSWIRVAMLADRTRLELTRPQIRALIPLTLTPDVNETSSASPPVMVILDERPFAHGGLADRIAAEIRTGFGYELPPEPSTLYVKDSRKEFGPDPRLTYAPTSVDDAYAVTLRSEGPVGLTFDSPTVRAPVFANTALVVHPILLTKEGAPPASLEEHFLSVGFRRYLDPAWLADDSSAASDSADVAKTWWINLPLEDDWFFQASGADPVVKGSQADGVWTVLFDPKATDPEPTDTVDGRGKLLPVEPRILCKIAASRTSRLVLLHLPLEKGRASLSVFALPSGSSSGGTGDVASGSSNLPLMLASIEWQVPTGVNKLEFTGQPFATSASPTTLLNWTRTGKNFELWHATKDGQFAPHSASELVAHPLQRGEGYVFRDRIDPQQDLSFEPPSTRYPNPLYVHRHHAVIATGAAKGIGRPVEVFRAAIRTFGDTIAFPPNDGIDTLRLVEFETSAQPLAWFVADPKSEALEAMRTAHFDLYSLLGNPTPPGFSLFIRTLGGDVLNSKLTQLKLSIKLLPQEQSISVTLNIVRAKGDEILRGILVGVNNAGDRVTITSQSIFSGGTASKATLAPYDPNLPRFELAATTAIELSIADITPQTATSEFWTDISLLTLASGDTGPGRGFDFGWFFSGGESPSLVEALAQPALINMTEVQGRIIAVSPPIAVEK
ncbi:hypothetical protein [Mesorhizobium sp. M0767]|uniref:hypothetical protein n=1 Tax=Mesorhizobium sp. M0767 TaxID=2956995 RepID=UPI003338EAB0